MFLVPWRLLKSLWKCIILVSCMTLFPYGIWKPSPFYFFSNIGSSKHKSLSEDMGLYLFFSYSSCWRSTLVLPCSTYTMKDYAPPTFPIVLLVFIIIVPGYISVFPTSVPAPLFLLWPPFLVGSISSNWKNFKT